MEKVIYTLNDIPKYTPWVNQLLDTKQLEKKNRTPAENSREFNIDKWGELYQWFESNRGVEGIDGVNKYWYRNLGKSLMYSDGEFDLVLVSEANDKYIDLVFNTIVEYLPISSIVELGAEFGNIILNIAKKIDKNIGIYAAEYTQNGQKLINEVAINDKIHISVGGCDFKTGQINKISVPNNSCVITSYASHYVPILDSKFIDSIVDLKPKVVIHFEPVYEHCDDSLYGLLRKRYIEINDYNTNLMTLIREKQSAGELEILKENPCVFAINPLLSISVIVWKPIYEQDE